MKLLVLLLVASAFVSACGPARAARDAAAVDVLDAGPLLPPGTIPFDFAWRQHVSIEWRTPDGATDSQSFDAVLQHRAGRLELVGLGPMDRPAFVIAQSDAGVTLDNLSGRELPFEPDYMIADVQKVYFPWLSTPDRGFDGARAIAHEGLSGEEIWEHGRLVERRFVRDDALERGEVVVRYDGWSDGDAPDLATLDSGWFGYRLTVRTLEQRRL